MKKIIQFPAFLAATLIFGSCGQQRPAESAETSVHNPDEVLLTRAQVQSGGIEFGVVTKQMLSHDVQAKGKLIVPPQNDAWIGTMISGNIEKILISEGDPVTKGQSLATLVSPGIINLQQEYLSLLSRKSQMEKEYARQKELGTEGITSQKKLQEAESDFTDVSAKLEAVRLQLELLHIPAQDVVEGRIHRSISLASPVTGFVDKVNTGIGHYAEPPDRLFHVIDKSRLILELSVFEKDIPVIKKGQRVSFTFGNLGNEEYEAHVVSIGKTVEENARTVNVLADFVNTTSFMLPGMFVSSEVHTEEMEVDALPEEAVVMDERPAFVYVTESDENADTLVFRKLPVKTGYVEDGFVQVELLTPMPANGRIVTKGTYFVKSVAMRGEE